MKVLMISTDAQVVDPRSSVHARMQEYARLVDGLEIIVYTRRSPKSVLSQMEHQRVLLESDAMRIHPIDCTTRMSFFWRAIAIGREILAARKGEWIITTQDPFETGLVGYLLKKKYRVPLHVQVHTDFLSPFFLQESWKNRLRARFASWLLVRAQRVRVVSSRIKDSLVARIPSLHDRIDVLPIFVDEHALAEGLPLMDVRSLYPGASPILLVMSRLTREKNIDLAVVALRRLLPLFPNALLLIVGEGPLQQHLMRATHDIRKHVAFAPWSNDVVSYYRAADVFVSPSWYEGYGRALVEAHAVGVPIVTTDVGAAREIVQLPGEGSVVPVGDCEGFVNAVIAVLQQPKKEKALRPVQISKDHFLLAYKQSWKATL